MTRSDGRTLPPRRLRLDVERFEDRLLLAVYTVRTTLDNGDNFNPLMGSLRWAIHEVDTRESSSARPDIIDFAIGPGVQAIRPVTPMMRVTSPGS